MKPITAENYPCPAGFTYSIDQEYAEYLNQQNQKCRQQALAQLAAAAVLLFAPGWMKLLALPIYLTYGPDIGAFASSPCADVQRAKRRLAESAQGICFS